jgi:hypothetical protein
MTMTFVSYNWQDAGAAKTFSKAITQPDFDIVSGVSVVVIPDHVNTTSVPEQLQYLFNNLPKNKKYQIHVSMPLSSLQAGKYPFQTRSMTVLHGGSKWNKPLTFSVPVLSATNAPLVSSWIIDKLYILKNIIENEPSGRFSLFGFGCAITSNIFFDSEMTIPCDVSETSAEAIANWAKYGVTETGLTTILADHMRAIAQGPGKGKNLTLSFLNPALTLIGQQGDNAKSYLTNTKAITDAVKAVGQKFTIMDQTLVGASPMVERPEIVTAANYAGSYACQLASDTYPTEAVKYAISRNAETVTIESSVFPTLMTAGFNGSVFV